MVASVRARAAAAVRPLRLPSAATTELMRACLGAPGPAPAALRDVAALKAGLHDPVIRGAGLMPLLLRAAGERAAPEVRSVLRASLAHEQVRLAAVGPACAETVAAEAGPALVLGGVAAAWGAYDDPALRHCHDLDLLVAGEAGARAHPSGFPVARHLTLFAGPLPAVRAADVLADAVPVEIAGTPARALDPADAVVHRCGHAATRGRAAGPLWGLDVAMLVRRHPELDWTRVADRARDWHVAVAVAPMLDWLARELDVAIPPPALSALRGARLRSGPRARLRLRRARLVPA